MARYTAGTLDLSILGYSDGAVASITKTVRALNSLSNSIAKMQGVNYGAQANKLTRFFEKLATTTNAINPEKLQMLASVASSFRGISSISKLDKLDYSKIAAGFTQLTVAITPFVNKVKEAEASLVALRGILSARAMKSLNSSGKSGGTGVYGLGGGLFGTGSVYRTLYWTRLLARTISGVVQAGSDYLETMNLWQVAMRENLDLAEDFVNKMNKAYGVSTKTTMQAQATFKNMIGSLGDLSDETAYQLSEAITQMALDYASLYNVKLTQAVDKFQSALAGQVRPIRSISGYDITEKTIHALYQSIGGTKTQRQLSRTEKQLLAILAVYKQMGASGALGDMAKTLDQFANQTRMMVEYWTELKSWTGLILKDLIDQSGALIKVNALLITFTEITKAIAKSKGLGEENFVNGIFESAENANDEIDELQGKLLDFDKFRSLSGQETGEDVAIDQKLLDAISGYSSLIDQAESKARQLAETWTDFWVGEDGKLTDEGKRVLDILEGIVTVLGILLTIKVATWIGHFVKGLFALKIAGTNVSTLGISVVIFALIEFVDAIKNGDDALATAMIMLAGTATVFVLLNSKIGPAIKGLKNFNEALVFLGAIMLTIGIAQFIDAWDDMSGIQRAIGIIGALAGAIAGAAVAIKLLGMNWAGAIGVGAMVAGTVLAVTSSVKIPNYEMGASDIDSGTVFRAGEFGKTEAVYTGSNGKTNVANVRQMEQAFYNALSRHSREGNGTIVVQTYLDGEKVYENTTARAKSRGNVWAKV